MTMDNAEGLQPGGFTVGNQVARLMQNTAGQFVSGMTVHFITSYGVSSSVWIPDSDYSPATVAELIRNKVAQLDAVSSLTK